MNVPTIYNTGSGPAREGCPPLLGSREGAVASGQTGLAPNPASGAVSSQQYFRGGSIGLSASDKGTVPRLPFQAGIARGAARCVLSARIHLGACREWN